jgi:hypothetical protein
MYWFDLVILHINILFWEPNAGGKLHPSSIFGVAVFYKIND